MKTILLITTTLLLNLFLLNTTTIAKIHPFSFKGNSISTLLQLREDLPSYVFEYDLERLYPATYAFYKKLDIMNRDTIYSYYLYHPKIKNVRHKIIELSIGKNKSKTIPTPFSLNQALIALKETKTKAPSKQIIGKTGDLRIISVN
jgi:hypothetical protein